MDILVRRLAMNRSQISDMNLQATGIANFNHPATSWSGLHGCGSANEFKSRGDLSRVGDGVSNHDFALQIEGICKACGEFHIKFNRFTWPDHFSKLNVVEPRHNRHSICARREDLGDQHSTGLKARFTLQHTWKHRKIGVMSLKYR